jgi:hypothetical protein
MTLTEFSLPDALRAPTGVHRWITIDHDRPRDSSAPTSAAANSGADVATWLTGVAADVEDWILRAHLTARVPVPCLLDPVTGKHRVAATPRLWANLPALAASLGRAAVSPELWTLLFLADLDTWYQALHHGSSRAATALQQRHQALGFPATVCLGILLTPEFAHTTRDRLLQTYRAAHAATGISTPVIPQPCTAPLAASLEATDALCA